jgi:hypothetical protein
MRKPRWFRTGIVGEEELPLAAICRVCGLPDGDYFEFVLPGCQVALVLTRIGIAFRIDGDDIDAGATGVYKVICAWILSRFGESHNLGSFTVPMMTQPELTAIDNFAGWLATPEHLELPLERLLPLAMAGVYRFWEAFPKRSPSAMN